MPDSQGTGQFPFMCIGQLNAHNVTLFCHSRYIDLRVSFALTLSVCKVIAMQWYEIRRDVMIVPSYHL